jgi:hypothetical protein
MVIKDSDKGTFYKERRASRQGQPSLVLGKQKENLKKL